MTASDWERVIKIDITQINAMLKPLTAHGKYAIENLDYSDECFGNLWIVMVNNEGLHFEIVRDRGLFSCRIGINEFLSQKWIDTDELSELYHFSCSKSPDSIENFIPRFIVMMKENESLFNRQELIKAYNMLKKKYNGHDH